jgi:hypothetical protein
MTTQHTLHRLLCSPDGGLLCYTFLRHVGLILDELSAQGLEVWLDPESGWRWHWRETDLATDRGYWALGEAIVDAVVTRHPSFFDNTLLKASHDD